MMTIRSLTSLAIISLLLCTGAFAQELKISGTVSDSTDRSSMIGVGVLLQSVKDTTQMQGIATDIDGKFSFTVAPGRYSLRISYIGYTTKRIPVTVEREPINLGILRLKPSVTTLKSVQVTANAIQVEQKGDTLQYNASAFKTNRDATAEDLITKMPGMTSDNSGLKAQGESVQKVLVDGKEFFGDDASIALKNLPAEIIEKIEVFDRLSEQSQLTGFDDGQTQKTVNIVTKKGKNQGQFGRVYAGAGEDGRYSAGGSINSFKGNSRISLIGLSNNINQQNFSNDDLLGVMSAAGGGGGRGGRGGGGGTPGSGGAANNFSVGQQSGISTTNSIGLNYSNKWGTKTDVSGSYFFNKSNNMNIADLSRHYITRQDSGLVYDENNRAKAMNFNHRLSLRLQHNIDSANSIILTPRLSFQNNTTNSQLTGIYTGAQSGFNQNISNQNGAFNNGVSFTNNLVYRHRFSRRGRSLSLGINTDLNDRNGNTSLNSYNEDESTGRSHVVDQRSNNFTNSFTLSPNLAYTEPIGKHGQFQVNYTPTYRKSSTDKKTYNFDTELGQYAALDTLLTNTFGNTYIAQRGGVGYRFNNRKLNVNTNVNVQQARLSSDQDFPYAFHVNRSFENVLPQLTMNYRFDRNENLRFMYRTTTDVPSVNQLQNVVDNRNPLFLKTGNPNLSQDYNHSFTLRYGKTNPTTSTSFLWLVSGSTVRNYITNTSIIAARDTTVNNVFLARGTQLSYPVNINGYNTARTLVTYGLPAPLIKSNINFNTGFNYNGIPALINGSRNMANNYGISQGLVVASNISENLDFTLSYTANYTIVKNSLQRQSDNNYFNQTGSFKLNWIFWKGFVFNTNLTNTLYSGLSETFDRSYWLWNASLGYKFLKDQSLEVKVTAFDLLKQNNNISRNVTQTYIEDSRTNVLTRYFMLMVTYRISHFNG